ncbi:MAG: rhomboid family intramembrane serine protease [Chitinophagaceae bacterium]|nr:MAG: rhomboid family intramembrane serine protease [Chitinophagaceae bacterium]
MQLTITLSIIIVTALVSFGSLNNQKMQDDLIFYGPAIKDQNQWYRFITHGLIHADLFHLIFNMYALYSFGTLIERNFSSPVLFGETGRWIYLLLYLSALVFASLPDYIKHKDNYRYRSLGASGAVAAVIFASIVLMPGGSISLFFIPGIPSWLFGILYLGVSAYLDRKGGTNVNHGAHFWGALYGLVFTIAFLKGFSDYDFVENFLYQIGIR